MGTEHEREIAFMMAEDMVDSLELRPVKNERNLR